MNHNLLSGLSSVLARLTVLSLLAATLMLPSSPHADASVSLYSCTIEAKTPSAIGSVIVVGDGDAWCGDHGRLVSGSKICLRRHRAWSPDWQGACRAYTVDSWEFRAVRSQPEGVSGTRKYRTRQYGRFDDLACGCPTFTFYDESSWRQI